MFIYFLFVLYTNCDIVLYLDIFNDGYIWSDINITTDASCSVKCGTDTYEVANITIRSYYRGVIYDYSYSVPKVETFPDLGCMRNVNPEFPSIITVLISCDDSDDIVFTRA